MTRRQKNRAADDPEKTPTEKKDRKKTPKPERDTTGKGGEVRPAGSSRGRRIADVIIAALLLLAIAADMFMIYGFSAESIEESRQTSSGFIDKLASIIFYDYDQLTPQQRLQVRAKLTTPIRKLAHFTEYALLGFLTGALLLIVIRRRKWMTWIFPAAFCLIYAASDEIHQIFSARGPSVFDVMIDFAGSLTGLCIAQLLVFLIRRALGDGRKKEKRPRRKKNGNASAPGAQT